MSEYVVDEAKNLLPFNSSNIQPIYDFQSNGGTLDSYSQIVEFKLYGFSENVDVGSEIRICCTGTINESFLSDKNRVSIRCYNNTNYNLIVKNPTYTFCWFLTGDSSADFHIDSESDWTANFNINQMMNTIFTLDETIRAITDAQCSISFTVSRAS